MNDTRHNLADDWDAPKFVAQGPIGWHLEKCPRCYGRGCFTTEPKTCQGCDGSGILAVAADGSVKRVTL